MSFSESIKRINGEVKKIRRNLFLYYTKDKANKVFIVIGVGLIVTGFLLLQYVAGSNHELWITFSLGFLVMMLVTTGFSLMHKSLRGAWL